MKNQVNTVNKLESDAQNSQEDTRQFLQRENDARKVALGSRIEVAVDLAGGPGLAAHACGVSVSTLRRYARGEVAAPFVAMIGLARASGVSLEWLATGQGPRAPDAPREVMGVSEGATYAPAPPAPPPGRAARQQQSQTRATPAPGGDADPAAGRSLSISMIAPPAPAAPDRGEFANLPLLARCLDAVQRLPAALSTEQRLALALRLAEALVYLAADQPVPPALDPEDLLALARLLYQLHPPTGEPGPGP